ncbi:hypothetical protein RF11_14927 [Thelohanellus kitauei]|uniref:Uncharacterized protein n=1 Tax=Thelohanellus kitauei TaxID=669202 RepID=A0A0C2JYX5_THEKT|nr:hypothetical protein RF11_14927 [Thelohanellus kitauei]
MTRAIRMSGNLNDVENISAKIVKKFVQIAEQLQLQFGEREGGDKGYAMLVIKRPQNLWGKRILKRNRRKKGMPPLKRPSRAKGQRDTSSTSHECEPIQNQSSHHSDSETKTEEKN